MTGHPDYPVSDSASLLGFVGGLHAGNYDITRVFIDGLYKIIGGKEHSAQIILIKYM